MVERYTPFEVYSYTMENTFILKTQNYHTVTVQTYFSFNSHHQHQVNSGRRGL